MWSLFYLDIPPIHTNLVMVEFYTEKIYQKAKLAPFSLWFVLRKFIFISYQVNVQFFILLLKLVNVLSLLFSSKLCLRGGINISLKNEDIGVINIKNTWVINYCWVRDTSLHIRHSQHLANLGGCFPTVLCFMFHLFWWLFLCDVTFPDLVPATGHAMFHLSV